LNCTPFLLMDKNLAYVDTDVSLGTPGAEIDDGAALILLLRHKSVEIVGVGSVFGNVPLQDAAMNLDRLLIWLGGERVPLGLGVERPLVANMAWFEDWQSSYGKTLPWIPRPTTLPAANLMIQAIRANPGQVSVLLLGPMTNLALAIRLDPGIVPLVRKVIVMGGSFNILNPTPEFNVHCDPEAAQVVFTAGWNLHILGLNVTRRVHFSRRDFLSLPDSDPAAGLLRTQAPGWIGRMEKMGWEQDGCALHDAVAAAYLIDDTIFQAAETSVEIELANQNSRGVTHFFPAAEGRPIVRVITGLDSQKCRDLIWSHLHQ
jgi:purine nucleosidase